MEKLHCEVCLFRQACLENDIICPLKIDVELDTKRYFIHEIKLHTSVLFDQETGKYIEVPLRSLGEYLEETLSE